MDKGKFIVFEGIDGCGKGTILEMVYKWLLGKKINKNRIVVTREPWTSKPGEKTREIIKSENNPVSRANELLDLYLNDRKEHLEKEINPSLEQGKIVLCDRYKYSTVAYQAAQGINIRQLVEQNKGFLSPDICIILNLEEDIALERISVDKKRGSKEMFEKKEFLVKVRELFVRMPELFPEENIRLIEASKSREEVFKETKKLLKEFI